MIIKVWLPFWRGFSLFIPQASGQSNDSEISKCYKIGCIFFVRLNGWFHVLLFWKRSNYVTRGCCGLPPDSRDCFGRMAAPVSDNTQRPLQNAMRLVKVAIQLDTGNRHKVLMFKSLDLPCLVQIRSYLANKCMREWRHVSE